LWFGNSGYDTDIAGLSENTEVQRKLQVDLSGPKNQKVDGKLKFEEMQRIVQESCTVGRGGEEQRD
ncbi:hypothetical protein chiPu_0028759, partial [Chiloscyllium punctatum]|nr:hypothetical protein [Chiloscyllium punctatum]